MSNLLDTFFLQNNIVMKKISLFIALLFITVISFTQVPTAAKTATTPNNGAKILVDKDVHDYGTIKRNADGVCYFTITNTGSEPLIISKAKGSCGCTVPDWPRTPIAPGESAKMKVSYATNRVGAFNKMVTISSNAYNSPNKIVRIKGKVLPPDPAEGAPFSKKKSPMMKS